MEKKRSLVVREKGTGSMDLVITGVSLFIRYWYFIVYTKKFFENFPTKLCISWIITLTSRKDGREAVLQSTCHTDNKAANVFLQEYTLLNKLKNPYIVEYLYVLNLLIHILQHKASPRTAHTQRNDTQPPRKYPPRTLAHANALSTQHTAHAAQKPHAQLTCNTHATHSRQNILLLAEIYGWKMKRKFVFYSNTLKKEHLMT